MGKEVSEIRRCGREAYQISLQGSLDEDWSEYFNGMAMECEDAEDAVPITTLTGAVDQAGLHGILCRIRDLNLKLISVMRLKPDVRDLIDKEMGG